MKRSLFIRITSFLLVMAMLLPMSPMGRATAEEPAATEILETEPVETSPEVSEEPVEDVTEPSEETQPTEDTTPTEETIPAEETLPEEETISAEETLPEEETEPTEETEPEEEEPSLFPGLPEDYVLTEEQLAEKEEMTLYSVAEAVAGLTAGYDYVDGQVMLTTESEEFARMAAAAFGGELESWEYSIALIRLVDATVLDAVTAAADMEQKLPAVYPNYITRLEPVICEEQDDSFSKDIKDAAFEGKDWEYWVRDTGTVNDPYITNPSSAYYQWMHDAVDTYAAWGVTTGSGIKVAVLDTGVQTDHPDLSGKVTTYNIGRGTTPLSDHGTHVAGIIAGKMGNGAGGAGIAPSASILSICVFYQYTENGYVYTTATDADIAKGINAAASQGAHIINMSLGGPMYNSTVQTAINNAVKKNVTVIVSMGNENNNTIQYPAGFNNVVAVGATNRDHSRASFSSYGSWADVSAPGVDIMSSVTGSGYELMDGTSMAAPVVSGVAALYMSVYGRVSPATMEKVLKSNVTKFKESGMGTGVVNAAAMFDVSSELPDYTISGGGASYSNNYKGALLPCDATLTISKPLSDSTGYLLVTLDGKTPSIKNGEIVNGEKHSSFSLNLSKYAGSTVTVKAAYISGLDIVNKVLTLKLKVGESTAVSSITVQGPDTLVAGKSGTFTATVSPDKADQDVTWSIVSRSSSQSKASINAKGVLKTAAAKSSSTITIRATSKAKSSIYKDFTVNVVYYPPVSKITLNATALKLNAGGTGKVSVASVTDTSKANVPLIRFDYAWSSSNKKVATVDANGNVKAIAKGSAKITCKVLDGSNKSATCTITVLQPVTKITVTGQTSIVPGSSAAYKAAVEPATANNKKVTWSLRSAPAGVTITAAGKLTVPKSVSSGSTIKIRATAADGSGKYYDFSIKTASSKATAVNLSYSGNMAATYAKNSLSKLTLYSIQRSNGYSSGNNTDVSAQISATAVGNSSAGFSWTTSNAKVATVDASGSSVVVRAVGSGTAKIICTALDGSNKKATLTVTVTTPASSLKVHTQAGRLTAGNYWDMPVVAFGKSVKNIASVGDTYGKPTNSKVTWDFTVKEYSKSGSLQKDWTSTIKKEKLVTLSASGVLAVKAGLKKYQSTYNGEFLITVTAKTTDGTNLSSSVRIYAVPPTTKMYVDGGTNWNDSDKGYYDVHSVAFYCDQHTLFNDYRNYGFTVKSSNPNVLGSISIYDHPDYYDYYIIEFTDGNKYMKGKTTFTITTADGSKSCTFTVNVK